MTVETMREVVRLTDRLAKLEESLKLAKKQRDAKVSIWTYGEGKIEDLTVPVKDVLRFYRREIRRLNAEIAQLKGE